MLPFEQKARRTQQPQHAEPLMDTFLGARGACHGALGARRRPSMVQQKTGIPENRNVWALMDFNPEHSLSHFCIPGSMTWILCCSAWT